MPRCRPGRVQGEAIRTAAPGGCFDQVPHPACRVRPAGALMHEMALCEGVLQVLEEYARKQGYARVRTVWLEIGELAGVEIEAMRFGFDVVTRGTLAEGAELRIITRPGAAWCLQCAKTVRVQQRFDACPDCGGYELQVTGGEELRVRELEVE
jgi:hydrogenase nickel incorporation protein HypA/HybF